MTYGSLVPEVKQALVTVLTARIPDVPMRRSTPLTAQDHLTEEGLGEAIWLGRNGGQDVEITATTGPMIGGRLDPNEAFTIWLTIGVQRDTSDGSEEVVQLRAYELLGEVIGEVSRDPNLGIDPPDSQRTFQGVVSHEVVERNQILDSGGWTCHLEVGLTCQARLTLT